MSLIRGNQRQRYQQPMPGQIPPQKSETLWQRAIKREKWILVASVVLGVCGLIEMIFTDNGTVKNVIEATFFTFIFLSATNFVIIPILQAFLLQSDKAADAFWDQKF